MLNYVRDFKVMRGYDGISYRVERFQQGDSHYTVLGFGEGWELRLGYRLSAVSQKEHDIFARLQGHGFSSVCYLRVSVYYPEWHTIGYCFKHLKTQLGRQEIEEVPVVALERLIAYGQAVTFSKWKDKPLELA